MTGELDLSSLPWAEVPLALARWHREAPVGDEVGLRLPPGPPPIRVQDLIEGAGCNAVAAGAGDGWEGVVGRDRSLADTVGTGMRMLVCGLNPSLHAADAGVGFVTANNRFWSAARAASVVTVDRDPIGALIDDGVGMTDLVKRATPRAAALTTAEYRDGHARLDRLCRWLRPAVVCFVGLAGWRAAVDRRAGPGPQTDDLGGCPVYVMPSTSGLNAGTSLDELVGHFTRALGQRTSYHS